jgi:hypothetical protein
MIYTRARTAVDEMISAELAAWKERTKKAEEQATNAIARAEMWEKRAKAAESQLDLLQQKPESGTSANTMDLVLKNIECRP